MHGIGPFAEERGLRLQPEPEIERAEKDPRRVGNRIRRCGAQGDAVRADGHDLVARFDGGGRSGGLGRGRTGRREPCTQASRQEAP